MFFLHFSRFLSKKETERNGSKETKRKFRPFSSKEKRPKEGLSDTWGTRVVSVPFYTPNRGFVLRARTPLACASEIIAFY